MSELGPKMNRSIDFAALDANTNLAEWAVCSDSGDWLVERSRFDRSPVGNVRALIFGPFRGRFLFPGDALLDEIQILSNRVRRIPGEDEGSVAVLSQRRMLRGHRRGIENQL